MAGPGPHGMTLSPGLICWNALVWMQHLLCIFFLFALAAADYTKSRMDSVTLHQASSSLQAFTNPKLSTILSSPGATSIACDTGRGAWRNFMRLTALRNTIGTVGGSGGGCNSSIFYSNMEKAALCDFRVRSSSLRRDNEQVSVSGRKEAEMWSAAESGKVLPARDALVKEAVEALRNSRVIAVPTDTLYGLACDACSPDAIRRIYEIKERNPRSPLAVCVADVDDVAFYGETSHLPHGLLGALLPGAVTLLLPRGEASLLSSALNPGIASIGIRIPDSNFIRKLSRSFGGALALTSANISSHLSTVRIEEFEHLWPQCAYVFDAGVLPGGRLGSTIVDLTREGTFNVIRSGSVLDETKEILAKFGLREVKS